MAPKLLHKMVGTRRSQIGRLFVSTGCQLKKLSVLPRVHINFIMGKIHSLQRQPYSTTHPTAERASLQSCFSRSIPGKNYPKQPCSRFFSRTGCSEHLAAPRFILGSRFSMVDPIASARQPSRQRHFRISSPPFCEGGPFLGKVSPQQRFQPHFRISTTPSAKVVPFLEKFPHNNGFNDISEFRTPPSAKVVPFLEVSPQQRFQRHFRISSPPFCERGPFLGSFPTTMISTTFQNFDHPFCEGGPFLGKVYPQQRVQ